MSMEAAENSNSKDEADEVIDRCRGACINTLIMKTAPIPPIIGHAQYAHILGSSVYWSLSHREMVLPWGQEYRRSASRV